jgi:amino-acid N-acetyltransferase
MSSEVARGGFIQLRTGHPEDLPQVLALLRQSDLPIDGIDRNLSHFILAESQGKLVGVIGLELYGSSALLRSAAVAEKWKGSGVGRELVMRALELARERGIEEVYLLTTTAEKYFTRFGFVRIGREDLAAGVQSSEEFRSACPSSAAVMRRKLA